jgi:hypothetical protein
VDSLRASISKTHVDGNDRALGDLTLDRFALDFSLAKFDMEVNVKLQYVVDGVQVDCFNSIQVAIHESRTTGQGVDRICFFSTV